MGVEYFDFKKNFTIFPIGSIVVSHKIANFGNFDIIETICAPDSLSLILFIGAISDTLE